MMTEKMRVSASSVMRRVAETRATPSSCSVDGARSELTPRSVPLRRMKNPASRLRQAVAGASVAWAAALPLTSFAASRPAPAHAWYAFAFAVYAAGSAVCHQRPERSFHLWSAQMPVCARCTGIYIGAALAAIVAAARSRQRSIDHPRIVLLLSALPTAATLVYEWSTGAVPSNWTRALAGAPMGAAVGFVIIAALPGPLRRSVQ